MKANWYSIEAKKTYEDLEDDLKNGNKKFKALEVVLSLDDYDKYKL
jgi:hypothetical protein